MESSYKIPESPDIVPTPLPFLLDDVWSVEEWRLGPCKLFLTGKNGVSDEVYCNVLLKYSRYRIDKWTSWHWKVLVNSNNHFVISYLSEFFRLSLVGLWLEGECMLPPTPPFPPNLYSNLESIVVLFFGISIMMTLYHVDNVDRNFYFIKTWRKW